MVCVNFLRGLQSKLELINLGFVTHETQQLELIMSVVVDLIKPDYT